MDSAYAAPESDLSIKAKENSTIDPNYAIEPIAAVSGWMKFLSIFSIILGVFCALATLGLMISSSEIPNGFILGLVYLPFTFLYFYFGIVGLKACGSFNEGLETGDTEAHREGAEKIARLIKVLGILSALGLVMWFGLFMYGLFSALS